MFKKKRKKKKAYLGLNSTYNSCSQAASNNTSSKQKIFNYRSSFTPEGELVKENCWCVLRHVPALTTQEGSDAVSHKLHTNL